jgi:hypothetical protein
MIHKASYSKIVDQLTNTYKGYATTYRAVIQPTKLMQIKNKALVVNDIRIRESLLEHVGHLPITATILYPLINDKDVDLGRTLTMLAIHDIGETIIGDKMLFQVIQKDSEAEEKQALRLLHPMYHKLYQEIEKQMTKSGKFAKSVDRIVPDIIELTLDPKISWKRYKIQAGFEPHQIVPAKRKKKMPFMEWNEFLKEFYDFLLKKLNTHLMNR